ncbi:hypothetical protein [Microaerobacter geothermalis]
MEKVKAQKDHIQPEEIEQILVNSGQLAQGP